jgi:hypothetical protein
MKINDVIKYEDWPEERDSGEEYTLVIPCESDSILRYLDTLKCLGIKIKKIIRASSIDEVYLVK